MADFSDVLNGDKRYHRIFENDRFVSFLNLKPICKGHTLVIPKNTIDDLFDMEDDALSEMILFSKKISHALKKSVPCKKVGVMVAGLVVRHAHIHLIPINHVSDLNFSLASEENDVNPGRTAEYIKSFLSAD